MLHLSTDITGVVNQAASALTIAAALHPSAAVCGTPTHLAMDIISELESLDRGRYAGPVGWVDTQGDGEWAIALRGGQVRPGSPEEIQLFAGAGIVADSSPEAELEDALVRHLEAFLLELGNDFTFVARQKRCFNPSLGMAVQFCFSNN